jgi:hypothetical protein
MMPVQGFLNFLADMGPRPSKKHRIERVNNDLGYSPENCRWATMREQTRNREVTLRDIDGTPIAQIADDHGVKYQSVYQIYRNGLRGAELRDAILSTGAGQP